MTTGTQNVAIGYDALGDVTTGIRNIGIGYNAANNFDTESDNIAIGYDALGSSSLAGAEQNVSIGNYSGDAITSGDSNTIIGHLSGTGVTSGSKNITLGWLSGDNITTGSNNVVIGSANVPSATADDQLSISSGDGGVTWITGNSNGFVTHANGSDHTFVIFGEEGDLYAGTGTTGNANGYQFSYGNGRANVTNTSTGTDFGINVPHNCVLERIDVVFGNSGNVSSGTTTFVVVKNGSNQSGNLSTNHTSGVHDTHHTGLNYAFTNGDRFNLRTTTSSRQVGPMRMTARFRRTG